MKKVLLLTVIALFVMMPFASFAKTALSDSDMSAITAQEGVSIYMNTIRKSVFHGCVLGPKQHKQHNRITDCEFRV